MAATFDRGLRTRRLASSTADSLMSLLEENKNLLELAGTTPFYCEVLTQEVGYWHQY